MIDLHVVPGAPSEPGGPKRRWRRQGGARPPHSTHGVTPVTLAWGRDKGEDPGTGFRWTGAGAEGRVSTILTNPTVAPTR